MDVDSDPLGSSKEAMREIGDRTVDLLVDQLTDPGTGRAFTMNPEHLSRM